MTSIAEFSETEVQQARERVAGWWRANAKAIREGDEYASHVTEAEKDHYFRKAIGYAADIEAGLADSCFAVRQRIYVELTGECPALLPK